MTAAQATKTEISLWAKVGYAFFAALITLITYRIGSIWTGHIAVILFTFFATWFIKPKARRMTRFAHAVFALTLLLATVFIQFLNSPDRVAAIESSGFLRFLFGDTAIRVILSIVMAFLISAALLAGPVLLVAYVSSEWILAMHRVYGVTRWHALQLLISTIFRTSYPYYVVENGEITQADKGGLLPSLGGPGNVVIKPYNAVVFEQSGKVTRIEGPGMILTKRFEFAKEIIDLRKQWVNFTVENVLTKDHVPLTFHCGAGFRIESAKDTAKRGSTSIPEHQGGQFRDVISGDYKVYQHTLYKAVYETTASGWKATSQGAFATQLLNIVREYLFENLYTIQRGRLVKRQSAMAEITEEVKERVGNLTPNWGTIVTGFKIASVEMPEEIEKEILGMWAAQYASKSRIIEARSRRDAAKIEAAGRRDASKIEAEAIQETARAEAAATVIRGRGEAEAKAELFRKMLDLGPSMDGDTLQVILKRLRSDEDIRTLSRLLLETEEKRYVAIAKPSWPLLSMGEEDEE